jgi:hypothetical protein
LLLTFSANVTAVGSKGRVEPLFTRYAQTYKTSTLDLKVEAFNDKPMEEMNNFNGYSVTLDFTDPIDDVSQIEFLFPIYTRGRGILDDDVTPAFSGRRMKVKSTGGGIRDFASVIYERQIPWLERKLDVNIAWRAGAGKRMSTLDVTHKGEHVDKINHNGFNLQGGFKMDTDIVEGTMTVIGNAGLILYIDSDDINFTAEGEAGSNTKPTFFVLSLDSAIMFNTFGRMTPVIETLFEHDFMGYTSLSLSPEVIYTFSDGLDLKFGVPFKLTKRGQNYAAVLEGTHRF